MPKPPKTDYARWLPDAQALGVVQNPLKVPYDIGLREAAEAATFVTDHWTPTSTLPGLSRIEKRLPSSIADDIRSLLRAVQEAQTNLILVVDPAVSKHGDRARFLIDQIAAVVAFVLDDGVDEPEDVQFAQIQEYHSQNGERSSALSQALRDNAALAAKLASRIAEVDSEFDLKLIAEAAQLAVTLAESGGTGAPAQSQEARDATLVRNQLLVLLASRVGQVRSAASYVFALHPAVLREVTSAYQRRGRAAARRAKKAVETAPQPTDPK